MLVVILILAMLSALLIAAAFYLLDRLDTVKGERDDSRIRCRAIEEHNKKLFSDMNCALAKLDAALTELEARQPQIKFWHQPGGRC